MKNLCISFVFVILVLTSCNNENNKNKIEWLKCSAGQRWSDEKNSCLGEAVKLDYFKIEEANNLLNQQIDGNWRLPTRKELESIVCKVCEGAKIDKTILHSISFLSLHLYQIASQHRHIKHYNHSIFSQQIHFSHFLTVHSIVIILHIGLD